MGKLDKPVKDITVPLKPSLPHLIRKDGMMQQIYHGLVQFFMNLSMLT